MTYRRPLAPLLGLSELRNNQELTKLLADYQQVYLTRYGQPVGVLLTVGAYEELIGMINQLEDQVTRLKGGRGDE